MIHIQFESPYFSGIKSVDSDKKALSFLKMLKRTHNRRFANESKTFIRVRQLLGYSKTMVNPRLKKDQPLPKLIVNISHDNS